MSIDKVQSKDLDGKDRWWFLRSAHRDIDIFQKLQRKAVVRVCYTNIDVDLYGAYVTFENYLKVCFEI